jgi:hypothetical protein
MRRWVRNLNKFEKSFGMKRKKKKFEITDRSSKPVRAVIYYLKSRITKDDKDGNLKPLDLTTMDDNEIAEDLKKHLKSLPDQDAKTIYIGTESYSLTEVHDEVDKRTDIGKDFIEMTRDLINEMGEKKWKNILKD